MEPDIKAVISTPDEALEACPFCGGRVVVVSTSWDWGPYDMRHAKFRCNDCGGLFEYAWRTDPWKRVPHAVEWFNTRTPAPPRNIMGYDTQQLQTIAELLQGAEITPERLELLCHELGENVAIAEYKFTCDLAQELLQRVETHRLNRGSIKARGEANPWI